MQRENNLEEERYFLAQKRNPSIVAADVTKTMTSNKVVLIHMFSRKTLATILL